MLKHWHTALSILLGLLLLSAMVRIHGMGVALTRSELALSEAQGELTATSKIASVALAADSIDTRRGDSLLVEVTRLRRAGRSGPAPALPLLPATPAPDTCATWVNALTARAEVLAAALGVSQAKRDTLDQAVGVAVQAVGVERDRADHNATTIRTMQGAIDSARKALATRPLPPGPTVQHLPGLLGTLEISGLDQARAVAAVEFRGVYAGLEARVPLRGSTMIERRIVVGVTKTLRLW